MNKVVYNVFGMFGLSKKATEMLAEVGVESAREYIQKVKGDWYYDYDPMQKELSRHDPRLVKVVEELGDEANGGGANLKVATIEGNKYIIRDYDGREQVNEPKDIKWIEIKE